MISFSTIHHFQKLPVTCITNKLHKALLAGPRREIIEEVIGKKVVERERIIALVTKTPEKIVQLIGSYFTNKKMRHAVNEMISGHNVGHMGPVNALALLIDLVIKKGEYGGSPGTWGFEARETLKLLLQRGARYHALRHCIVSYWSQPSVIESQGYNIQSLCLYRIEKLMVKDIRESMGLPVLPGDEDENAFYDSKYVSGCQIS